MKKYYLVTDSTAAEVERCTGLRGRDTFMGALVERPEPFDMHGTLAEINRALHPMWCTCGSYAVVHQPNCPAWKTLT